MMRSRPGGGEGGRWRRGGGGVLESQILSDDKPELLGYTNSPMLHLLFWLLQSPD